MRRPPAVAPQSAALVADAQCFFADAAGRGPGAGIAANFDDAGIVLSYTGHPIETVAAEIHQATAGVEPMIAGVEHGSGPVFRMRARDDGPVGLQDRRTL